MKHIKILWTDDEIDMLKPHILFLEEKNYHVDTANNGYDAIEKISNSDYDLVFLDENMPGLSGLEVLNRIKNLKPSLPVVMITKSEEEDIMEAAIGSKISDYLIKPVNPNQILLSIKKNIDNKRLVAREITMGYQSNFNKIGGEIMNANTADEWIDIYKKLIHWELELESSDTGSMDEVLQMQKSDANNAFCKFISRNYLKWFSDQEGKPLMSHNVMKNKVFPLLEQGEKVVLLMIDNLRYDQFQIIAGELSDYMKTIENGMYYSILPTVTHYARNAFFAGLMPADIKKIHPAYWHDDDEDGHKNEFEKELLQSQMKRAGMPYKLHFEKVASTKAGRKLMQNLAVHRENDLVVIVYNFVDLMSHARTDMDVLKELASDEAAYRSLTLSWFRHSELLDIVKSLAHSDAKLVITTDHGSIRVQNPLKVVGDRFSSTNLRYKHGKNLDFKPKEVFEIKKPEEAHLPGSNISSSFIFARGEDYLVYPKNYNHFVNMYKNTFQHGGISMEEMLIPLVIMEPK
jgi:CheY-like chemotaxis protein